jgi:glycosyltransferase involved in cell wall biosynthesis
MTRHPPKKVCYICYRRFPDTNFEHYSKAVSDSGYDVTIISYQDKDQKIFETRDNRKIIRIPLPGNSSNRKRALTFISKVIEILKKNHFSVVHIHNSCPYFFLIKILASGKAKYIYHTTSYPISTTKFMKYKQMIKNFIQCLLMDKIIVQSEELRLKLIGIRNLKRTDVVPVGFNKNYFYPIDKTKRGHFRSLLNIDENHPLLVYCGAIAKLRQLDRLMEAFKQVHKTFPDVKLLMVGDGNALEDLKEFTVALGISKSLIFTGRVSHHEVVNYIAMADIGISYVPINENYNYNPPLKTFEYLACGLLTVATNTVSNRRIIKDGFNGILVDDNSEQIASVIVKLLNDRKKQIFLAKNARESIMAYDFDYITKSALVPLYKRLLRTD